MPHFNPINAISHSRIRIRKAADTVFTSKSVITSPLPPERNRGSATTRQHLGNSYVFTLTSCRTQRDMKTAGYILTAVTERGHIKDWCTGSTPSKAIPSLKWFSPGNGFFPVKISKADTGARLPPSSSQSYQLNFPSFLSPEKISWTVIICCFQLYMHRNCNNIIKYTNYIHPSIPIPRALTISYRPLLHAIPTPFWEGVLLTRFERSHDLELVVSCLVMEPFHSILIAASSMRFLTFESLCYVIFFNVSDSQPVVRVPLVVHGGL